MPKKTKSLKRLYSICEEIKSVKGLCSICNEENEENVIECTYEKCPFRFYHTRCMNPKLRSVPPAEAKWVCPSCLCRECFTLKDHELSVLCNGCNHCYHIYCMKPPLAGLPKGEWFCPSCEEKHKIQRPRNRNIEPTAPNKP